MKKVILIALVACFAACQEEIFQEENRDLNGKWKVVKFIDHQNNTVITPTPENSQGLDIIITFNDLELPHRFEGHNTSNVISGTFEYGTRDRCPKDLPRGSAFE